MDKRETEQLNGITNPKVMVLLSRIMGKIFLFIRVLFLIKAHWLKEGERVEFQIIQGEKGLHAEDVIVLDKEEN